MKNKNLLHLGAALVIASTSVAQAESKASNLGSPSNDISGSVTLGYDTDYNFRGAVGDETRLNAAIAAGGGNASASSDGSIYLAGKLNYGLSNDYSVGLSFRHYEDNFGGKPGGAGAGDQDTLGLSIAKSAHWGTLSIGWNHHDGGVYDWPFLGNSTASSGTNEVELRYSISTSDNWTHGLSVVYDFEEFDGLYASVFTRFSTAIANNATLNVTGLVSYVDDYWGSPGQGLPASVDNSGFNNAELSVSVDVDAGRGFIITPYVSYNLGLDVIEDIRDAGTPLSDSDFIAGIRASYNF